MNLLLALLSRRHAAHFDLRRDHRARGPTRSRPPMASLACAVEDADRSWFTTITMSGSAFNLRRDAVHMSAFDQSGHGRGWDRDGYCCQGEKFGLTSAASAGGH